jgi:hypothetical protein
MICVNAVITDVNSFLSCYIIWVWTMSQRFEAHAYPIFRVEMCRFVSFCLYTAFCLGINGRRRSVNWDLLLEVLQATNKLYQGIFNGISRDSYASNSCGKCDSLECIDLPPKVKLE